MGSKGNCQFILERIDCPGTIVLDKPEHTYTCGRAKDNQIVCLSLTVSRRHCIFYHGKDELYVTDLKSSNGLFINGIAQEPFQTTRLNPNDIIGIGCPNVDAKDNTMFVYKLHIIAQSCHMETDQGTSALSETVLNVEHICTNKFDAISKRKRGLINHDANGVPNKLAKLDNENCILETNSLEDKSRAKSEDVEILHISTHHVDNNCDKVTKNTELNTDKHIDTDMFKSSNIVTNTNFQFSTDCKMESDAFKDATNTNSLVSLNKEENAKQKENSVTCWSNEDSNKYALKEIQGQCETDLDHSKAMQKNHFDSQTKVGDNNANVISHLEKNSQKKNASNDLEKSKPIFTAGQIVMDSSTHESVSSLPENFIQNADCIIKLEDELQLTDTEENLIVNSTSKISVPLASPIKLKKVQQMPKTKFSEDDVVNISDSEDDVFPCSQLFDIGFGMNMSVKDEIKEEPMEAGNERFSVLDEADLVISLTDSEDEDNNWLHRLSRSQILNETDDINVKVENEEVQKLDMDLEIVDFGKPIVNMSPERNVDKSKHKEEDRLLKDVRNLSKMSISDIPVSRMEVDAEILPEQLRETVSTTIKSGKVIFESPKRDNFPLKQKEEESSSNTSNSSRIEIPTIPKKRSLEKKVPQIEPPHLPTRKSSSSTTRAKPTDTRGKPATQRLSAKEKKEQLEKLKLEQYLHAKEQKNRKTLYKWADCLPPSKTKTRNLSKEEKKVLADSRKEKLKKLAMEERKSLEDRNEKKRIVSKPKAKVTTKTRNDVLVAETISASKLEDTLEKSTASSSKPVFANHTSAKLKTTETVKNAVDTAKRSSKRLTNKLMLNDISNLGKIPKKTTPKHGTAVVEKTLKILPPGSKGKKIDDNTRNKSGTDPYQFINQKPSAPQTSNIKSLSSKKKKRVSFSTIIQTVREYEIDESHVLKKLAGKDAPIPPEKVAVTKPRTISTTNEKFNEFLWRIFTWNPVWLEEQEHLNTTAPVVKDDELHVMLTYYRSYEEYYKVISPLLLLEIWYGISNEFQSSDQKYRRPTYMCSIVENSIQTNLPATNVRLSTLMLEVLVTREDMHKKSYPVFGDLVYFEYVKNCERKQSFHKVFAYVTNIYTTILTPLTRYNKDLLNYTKNPRALLTYTVITRELDRNISVNRVQRFRAVAYLRPSLRMVQALEYLPNSPLVNLIISPRVDMYQLPVVPEFETMITGDKLNQKQMEAVCKVTKAVVQKDTKLCFIQGPPGTGKSKVIVNIVTQILYGNNRYNSNGSAIKILVCAPSNAAIDEIVLRLLNVRSAIKQEAKIKPFRMVRIGRSEMMHSTVRNISVTELAKRDLKKTAATTNSIPPDSVENEKLLLDSKMNALKCELANSHYVDDTYKQHLRMKLAEIAAKKELLNNRTPLNEINDKERMKLQRGAENRILEYADIITCTLSSCYTNQMESIFGANKKRITVCIVDEATQSCEAESIIPLMLGVNVLVLVGDPNQLPATILSPQAKKLGLDQSLFSRVQNAFDLQSTNPIIMLDTQYRMQPKISYWANRFFYGGKLINAVERSDEFPFHPYLLLNLNTNENKNNFTNNDEANFVANIIYCMLSFSNLDNWESCISYGILTPYNDQKAVILSKINERTSSLPESIKKKMKIEVNTVDGFQGQERDVIIMSCVRSEKIGFMSDRQRLCVALTRAKHSLIVCGNFNIFKRDVMWNSMLSDAKARRVFFTVNANADPNEIKSYVIKRGINK